MLKNEVEPEVFEAAKELTQESSIVAACADERGSGWL